MSGTLGIIEVPSAKASHSPQPPRRHPAEYRFGSKPLLEWVVRRVTDSLLLDQVVVLVDPAQAEAIRRVAPSNVAVCVGQQPDELSRFAGALRHYDAQHGVRVRLNSPFVDPQLIDRLICTAHNHPGCDYIGYAAGKCGPSVLAQLGLFAEFCRAEAVYRAERLAWQAADRCDSLRYVYSHPDAFHLRLIAVPQQLDRNDLRLAVHGEEDRDHAQIIFDALGPERLEWQRIAELLDQQPALRQRMALLNQAEHAAPAAT